MKGETAEAIALLEKIVAQGDEEDKEAAYFYLGKIQELSGNTTSSNFFYKQSLSRATDVGKLYWLAERNAATSTQAETFLKTPINLKGKIQKVFGTAPAFCLFQDGSIGKIDGDRVIGIPQEIPEGSQILHISSRGTWYQPANEDSLFFLPFHSNKPRYSFNISKASSYSFQDGHAMIQSGNQLSIINKAEVQTNIAEKYNGCIVESFFKPTNEYILNCPDNALHFLSVENGTEERIIAQFDVIQNTLIHKNQLFLVSNGFLYSYAPKSSTSPLWKVPINNVESIFAFGNNIAILEASGRVSLMDQNSGITQSAIRSDATNMYPLAKGTIGLVNEEGAITAVDTLLRPLWNFNFTEPITMAPVKSNDDLYFYFGGKKLQPILTKFYGKRILLSEILAHKAAELCEQEQWDSLNIVLDSLFKLEPGNAEGWFFKALYLEKQNGSEKEKQIAWSEAVRLSASNPRVTNLILNRYGKAIGAKYINLLPISPKTRYPQLFGNKKDLFTLDPAADKLFCINPENGELRWSRNIGKLENSPVVSNDDKNIVIASGYKVSIHDLNRESQSKAFQLPGKAFETRIYDNAIYVSTWNGFLLKISRQDNHLVWSRKIYSVPFFTIRKGNSLYVCSMEGEFNILEDSEGLVSEGYSKKIQGTVSHMAKADSTIAIATTNSKLFIFNPHQKERPPFQILMEATISSLQQIHFEESSKLLIGLSDQSVLLYSNDGAPLWKFKGKNSIFTNPFVKDDFIWIDQGNEIISLSIKDGKVQRRFSTPGGAGSPFIMNHTLFSASPKRVLYGFSL